MGTRPFSLISEWEPDPFSLISEWEPDLSGSQNGNQTLSSWSQNGDLVPPSLATNGTKMHGKGESHIHRATYSMSCSDGTITCRLRREEPSFTSTNTCIFCFRADFTQPCKTRNTTQPYNERSHIKSMQYLQAKNWLTKTVTFSWGSSRLSASFTKMWELSVLAENALPALNSLGWMFRSCEMESLLCIFLSFVGLVPRSSVTLGIEQLEGDAHIFVSGEGWLRRRRLGRSPS